MTHPFIERQTHGKSELEYENDIKINAAQIQDEQTALTEVAAQQSQSALLQNAPEDDPSFADRVNAFHDDARDVIMRAPMNAVKGTYKAYTNTLNMFVNKHVRSEAQEKLNDVMPGAKEASDAIDAWFSEADGKADEVTQSLSQFFVPFLGYMKVFQAAGAGEVAAGFAADFVASVSALDPHMDRLADVAQNLGLENDFIDWLASDGGNEAENRLKNGIDSTLAGAAAVGLAQSAKAMYHGAKSAGKTLAQQGLKVGPAAQRGSIGPKPSRTTQAIVSSDVKRGPKPQAALIDENKIKPVADDLLTETDDELAGMALRDFSEFDTRKSVTHQINFDKVVDDDDLKAVLASTADRFKGTIDKSRRGVITNKQLQAFADDLNVEVDVIKPILERQAGDATLTPEMVVASRKVLNDSAGLIRELAESVSRGTASDLDKLRFRRQMEFHSAYQIQFMGARAEVGRSLQAFNIPLGSSDAGMKQLQQLTEKFHGTDLQRVASDIAAFDDAAQLNKYVRETSGMKKATSVIREVFINSILSSPKTHVVNLSGNALFQSMNIAERAVAARVGRMMGNQERVLVGEAQAQLYGALSGVNDAWRLAWQTFKTGDSAMSRVDSPILKAISSENLELSGPLGRFADLLGSVIRSPTERVMAPGDEFFKAIAYRSELARSSYRQAMKEGGDPARIKQLMESPSSKMVEEAESYALYSTFQLPGGPISQTFQKAREGIPGAWVVLPFIRTPGNILKEAGKRSPIAPLLSDFRQAVKAGGPERDMALAQWAMGSLTAGLTASLVLDGTLTGAGPTNYQARQLLEKTGWQPYSWRFPDGSYQSYQRFEPLAMTIGAVADISEIMAAAGVYDPLSTEDEKYTDVVNALVAGIANNTINKTYMSGASEFFHAMDDPARYMDTWLKRVGTAVVPFSLLRRDLARIDDPYLRQAWTMMDKLQAQIPGYSDDLPFSRDVFGKPREPRTGSLLHHMSPFPDTEANDDPMVNELARIMQSTQKVPISMPSKQIEGLNLDNRQYSKLIDLSRNEMTFQGMDFEQAINAVMNEDFYEMMTDDQKVQAFKDVQRGFDEMARFTLIEDDEELSATLENRRMIKALRGAR